ncbi:MAG: FixH family protein [Chloroflexota bacterium]
MTLLLLLSISLFALAGCRQSNQPDQLEALQIGIVSPLFPPLVGEDTVRIKVLDANDQPIDDLALNLKGDMTHAGMEPVLSEAIPMGEGIYEVPFEWTMGGDWILTVDAEDQDGLTTKRRFDLFVDGEMPFCGDVEDLREFQADEG